ncbi:hypothetical protein MOQ_001294 [Trypanosoma cruzi marinkellei]|uniref:Trypanosoma Tc-38 (p38) protein domain-containing protein n=1 Tax=Trypanosoma cruzi marinkellei TaxID=85056 RepID=K2PBM3_TRYCR|nr:hypothetical protein MOQ_001294 [Trypanosoma cruzi marinkellei]
MATIRRKAPRLFTGAVFTEEISRALMTFSDRHNLTSDVWVPKRLVGKIRAGATLLPNAILCDLSLIPGCGAADIKTIGFERVLVNAAHTTDVEFFEGYQNDILNGLAGALPLTVTGALHRDVRLASFAVDGNQQKFQSPYWIKRWGKRRQWVNVEETPFPGRLNPTDCTSYEPHTFTNQLFSRAVVRLMRRRASRYGYVSRTWITLKEGEAHGTQLDAERIKDGPPIFVSQFSGSGQVQAVEFFCADQFEDCTVFPTQREIDLAASGVFIGAEKVRGYPLLASLAVESSSSDRHRRMAEETAKLSDPVVFGATRTLAPRLLGSEFKESLRKFSLLRGFSKPHFILHTAETVKYLRLKPQEQGVLYIPPATPGMPRPEQSCLCVFNVQQFEEPAVVEEMILRTPIFFFTQKPMAGPMLVECARAQCKNREYSHMWLIASALDYLAGAWAPSPTAVVVPKDEMLLAFCSKMYNASEVSIPSEALEWWPNYNPHDMHNNLYRGKIRMLLSLRAWERGYKSPLWVTQTLLSRLGITIKRQTRRKLFLTGKPFEKPPTVLIGDDEYINMEEIKNPDVLLASMSNADSDINVLAKKS